MEKLRFKDSIGNEYGEWKTIQLGNVGFFKTSSIDKKSYSNQRIVNLVNYMDVYRGIELTNQTVIGLMKVSATENQINENNLLQGDILFTPSSETPNDIGHSVVIREDLKNTLYSYHLVRFRPNFKIDNNYANYFCNTSKILDQIAKMSQGATRFTISLKSFSEITVPISQNLEEQIKIGRFLSSFDRLIQKQQDKLGFLKELKKGYLQKMFPKNDANVPEIRFKEFTDSWEQYKFSQILDLIKDGTHGTHQNVEEGIYLLSAKNIKNGEIVISANDRKISESEYLSIHKNFQIKSGDILLTIVGTIGDCAILKEPNGITFQRSVAYLRPGKKVTSNFLYSTIMTAIFQNDLRKGQSISAQAGVYLNELGKLEIKLPSIDEQKLIGSLFEKIDNLITLHQRKLDQLENLKKGYMQRLFA